MTRTAHRLSFQQPTSPSGKFRLIAKHGLRGRLVLLSLLLIGAVLAGCGGARTTGKFVEVSRIEPELERGVSTQEDVRRVLGEPNGSGVAFLPTQTGLREVWYYEDIGMTRAQKQGEVVWVDMRYQVLLVFFRQEKFDGFMWFSSAERAEGW